MSNLNSEAIFNNIKQGDEKGQRQEQIDHVDSPKPFDRRKNRSVTTKFNNKRRNNIVGLGAGYNMHQLEDEVLKGVQLEGIFLTDQQIVYSDLKYKIEQNEKETQGLQKLYKRVKKVLYLLKKSKVIKSNKKRVDG